MTPNLPLLRKVLDHIDAHPEEWRQEVWVSKTPCGTAHCIAGHAVVLSGGQFVTLNRVRIGEKVQNVHNVAADLLGLDDRTADDLFDAGNTREDIQRIAERIAERAGERL